MTKSLIHCQDTHVSEIEPAKGLIDSIISEDPRVNLIILATSKFIKHWTKHVHLTFKIGINCNLKIEFIFTSNTIYKTYFVWRGDYIYAVYKVWSLPKVIIPSHQS